MPKRILIVEDDADLLELLSFNLKKAGFSVATAADGVEGLKKARSLVPNLILLDIMLPELDGFAVCETLRKDSSMASVPIVMLTALNTQLSRFAGIDAGANEYITKPFSPKELVSKLHALLKEPSTKAV